MNSGGRKAGRRVRAKGASPAARRSPLMALLVALSLIVQLFAAATPPALAAPAFAGADDAAIAAELKAVFGDAAQLCVQINDDKAPAKTRTVRPLLRSMSALPLRRPGCGVCPARAAGFAGAARHRRSCDPRAAWPRRSSRVSRPAKPGSGASPHSLTVVRRARSRRAFAFLQTRGLSSCLFSVSAWPRARLPARSSPLGTVAAHAHAVCGNRIFPSTLAIDDPGVTDELTLPSVTWLPKNSDGVQELDIGAEWAKTIFPNFAISVGGGPTWLHPGGFGWDLWRPRRNISSCAFLNSSSWPRRV